MTKAKGPKPMGLLAHRKYLGGLFITLSIYCFVQSTFFFGTIAHYLYFRFPPQENGIPLSFSPYHLIPYCNWVLRIGWILSCVLFVLAIEPYTTAWLKNRRLASIPIAILITPIYFILIYFIAYSVKIILSSWSRRQWPPSLERWEHQFKLLVNWQWRGFVPKLHGDIKAVFGFQLGIIR